jgi:hypothetical protein
MMRDFRANNDDKEKATFSYSVVERGRKESPHVCESVEQRNSVTGPEILFPNSIMGFRKSRSPGVTNLRCRSGE